MNKAVLISITPKECAKILNEERQSSLEKTRPKIETPFKCYIYCTNSGRPLVYGDVRCMSGWEEKYTQTYGYSRSEAEKIWGVILNGKVIGEFICDRIEEYWYPFLYKEWHISDLKKYDEPKELSEFRTYNPGVVWEEDYPIPTHEIKRPPQSWCYVEEI